MANWEIGKCVSRHFRSYPRSLSMVLRYPRGRVDGDGRTSAS